MDNLRDQQQCITILKQVASQPQNQPRLVSVPPAANVPLPPFPQICPSDKGLRTGAAENANAHFLCHRSRYREKQSHPVTRSQMDNLRDQQQRNRRTEASCQPATDQPRLVSVPPAANVPLPPISPKMSK